MTSGRFKNVLSICHSPHVYNLIRIDLQEISIGKKMVKSAGYVAKKNVIRNGLLRCARAGEFPSYGEFGESIGMPARGPWKAVLDDISREETENGLPDITWILKNKKTKYPGQMGFVSARTPTPQQKALAKAKIQEVIDKYCPGTPNPY